MTGPELAQLKAMIPQMDAKAGAVVDSIVHICDYMLSCLTYGDDYYASMDAPWFRKNCSETHAARLTRLGVINSGIYERVLWEEMKNDFAEYAIVHKDVSTDSEGLSYNSLEWRGTPSERLLTIQTQEGVIEITLKWNGQAVKIIKNTV